MAVLSVLITPLGISATFTRFLIMLCYKNICVAIWKSLVGTAMTQDIVIAWRMVAAMQTRWLLPE